MAIPIASIGSLPATLEPSAQAATAPVGNGTGTAPRTGGLFGALLATQAAPATVEAPLLNFATELTAELTTDRAPDANALTGLLAFAAQILNIPANAAVAQANGETAPDAPLLQLPADPRARADQLALDTANGPALPAAPQPAPALSPAPTLAALEPTPVPLPDAEPTEPSAAELADRAARSPLTGTPNVVAQPPLLTLGAPIPPAAPALNEVTPPVAEPVATVATSALPDATLGARPSTAGEQFAALASSGERLAAPVEPIPPELAPERELAPANFATAVRDAVPLAPITTDAPPATAVAAPRRADRPPAAIGAPQPAANPDPTAVASSRTATNLPPAVVEEQPAATAVESPRAAQLPLTAMASAPLTTDAPPATAPAVAARRADRPPAAIGAPQPATNPDPTAIASSRTATNLPPVAATTFESTRPSANLPPAATVPAPEAQPDASPVRDTDGIIELPPALPQVPVTTNAPTARITFPAARSGIPVAAPGVPAQPDPGFAQSALVIASSGDRLAPRPDFPRTDAPPEGTAPAATVPFFAPLATESTAPAPAVAPNAPVAPPQPLAEQVADALVSRAELAKRDGATEFHMRLDPPELGRVQVKLVASGDDLRGQVLVADDTVRRLLESQLPELRHKLEAAGVTVQSLDVATDPGGGNRGAFRGESEERPELAPPVPRATELPRRPRAAPVAPRVGALDVTV